MIPNIIVIAFRTLSPELDEALANDDLGEILIHLSATAIGIILAFSTPEFVITNSVALRP